MKLVIAAISSVVSCLAVAGFVNSNQAAKVAESFSSSVPFAGNHRIVNVIPETDYSGNIMYYSVIRENGSAIVVSSDTDRVPVVAVIDSAVDKDGNLFKKAPVWDLVSPSEITGSGTSATLRSSVKSGYPRRLFAGDNGASDENNRLWNAMMAPRKLKTSSSQSQNEPVVIDGFEHGGRFTHWNQDVAIYSVDETTGLYSPGSIPVYNYYMHSSSSGGPETGGLGQDGDATSWPCGCVATAIAAASQCLGSRGIVENPLFSVDIRRYSDSSFLGNFKLLPGAYDWSVLPSNFGGEAPEARDDSELTAQARELLGRVSFNCSLSVSMKFDSTGSAAYSYNLLNPIYESEVAEGTTSNKILVVESGLDHMFFGSWMDYESDSYSPLQNIPVILRTAIPYGVPVLADIITSGSSSGHCVLLVGYYESGGEYWARVFMGYGGRADAWCRVYPSSVIPKPGSGSYNRITAYGIIGSPNKPSRFVELSVTNKYCIGFVTNCLVNSVKLKPYFSSQSYGYDQVPWSFITGRSGVIIGYDRPYQDAPASFLLGERTDSLDWYPSNNYVPSVSKYVFGTKSIPVLGLSATISDFYVPGDGFGAYRGPRYSSVYSLGYAPQPLMGGYKISGVSSHVVSLAITNSLRCNGFTYGTPMKYDDVASALSDKGRPIVVISGTNGVSSTASSYVSSLESSGDVFVFFMDVETDTNNNRDTVMSVGVFDPSVTTNLLWSPGPHRMSYGAFGNDYDIKRTIDDGVRRYRYGR